MAVISVSIIESSDQVVSGIPRSITIETNIPASIFYTLDGSDPTLFSDVYIGKILLPTDKLSIILKVFASNGVDSSPILTDIMETNILNNARLPRSATTLQSSGVSDNEFPFGTAYFDPNQQFLNPGDAAQNVDNVSLPEIVVGYGADGYANSFSNEPYNFQNYNIKYSTKNANGEMGPNIGTLPYKITVDPESETPNSTDTYSSMFDPRALVIYQNVSDENPNDPPQINRQFSSFEDPERSRNAALYYNVGLDSPPISGSFVSSFFNPRTNEITYYYRDSLSNQWLISTTPYNPNVAFNNNLSGVPDSRKNGSRFVFEWNPFASRKLF